MQCIGKVQPGRVPVERVADQGRFGSAMGEGGDITRTMQRAMGGT